MTTATRRRPLVAGDWVYRPYPLAEGTPQVVCFPHAGGDVTAFAELAVALAPALEVWAVRLPARGGRYTEPMPETFDALVSEVAGGLTPHLRPGSLFYGQSFGALLAYEVARELRPDVVVPACASAPAAWPGTVPATDHGAEDLLRRCGLDAALPADDTIRELAVATIRTDMNVCRSYRHRADSLPDFAVHAVAGAGDTMLPPAEMAGWARATTGPFTTSVEPGGHLLATPLSAGPAGLLRALHARGGDRVHHHR
ncbi:thioesterase II family protein [Amycolatopsis sp. H20-H5]|uniref:thioesterase II family protein n=1 Tax=Amycolatopsis sp. H20-H5 TaxID=3046309 RepID=UPI002DB6C43C|nr:thioesterase domain-containing protein [Amycolatopsis sp. H20-H5]MEC3978295.1 thioesterase domain-containing protein [Amycolatopsis sp. H20-H5]